MRLQASVCEWLGRGKLARDNSGVTGWRNKSSDVNTCTSCRRAHGALQSSWVEISDVEILDGKYQFAMRPFKCALLVNYTTNLSGLMIEENW